MTVTILHGDCRDILAKMPDASIDCCVTSPPYWGLRDYEMEGQIGLEASPEEFISIMVQVFREVRRVLKPEGTLWLNMGDSYAGAPGGFQGQNGQRASRTFTARINLKKEGNGLKPKDLVGMPWRVAFALQADGWYLRQDIIWSKPNPMPESTKDRCTKAHEYIFLLSKSPRYYYDQEAILEPCSPNTHARLAQDVQNQMGSDRGHGGEKTNGRMKAVGRKPGNKSHKGTAAYEAGAEEHRTKGGLVEYSRKLEDSRSGTKNNESFDAAMAIMPDKRNKRSVWTVGSEPFREAHFATFPPALIEPCILAGCPKGGVVLDPFFGAGTTGLVSDRLGRNCLGIELSEKYIDIAARRIREDAGMFDPLDIRLDPEMIKEHEVRA